MVFSSSAFLFIFFPIVLVSYYLILRKYRFLQNILLLTSSLIFYAFGEPFFVFIMLLSIIVNWYFGILVAKFADLVIKQKWILFMMVFFNVGLLFIYKYLTFTLTNLNLLFNTNVFVPKIFLPIGISFFTFHSISYVMDIYRKHSEVQKNPLYVGLYIVFFPQLIAGPIVRYKSISKQLTERKENWLDFCSGVERFIIGLSKKVLIANNMALVADYVFALPCESLTFMISWIGGIAYTLQIYYDFSGYSDMAIGLGRMFGFHFLENFNFPYISKSISEFWRRWHISLGSWFKDYIYIPLGGSKVNSKSKLVFNIFVVWLLTGLWHGANWTFIAWGILYFILIVFEKITKFDEIKGFNILKYIYTILFTIVGFVIFRSLDINAAGKYLMVMFSGDSKPQINSDLIYVVSEFKLFFLFAIIFVIPWLKLNNMIERKFPIIKTGTIFILFLLSIMLIVKGSYNPFIYFNF